MRLPRWHEKPIAKHPDRRHFDCGDEDLNDFLQRYARQSHERGSAKAFVAVESADPVRVLGFCSVAPASLATFEKALSAARRL